MRFETSFKKTIKNSDDIYVSNFNGKTGVCRKLTPRECLRLMGYSDEFRIVVPDQKMYRQAGNSIVVNILESIIKEIIKTGVFYD
jgi:DNA (cytosine-5)-methyltransferase 1